MQIAAGVQHALGGTLFSLALTTASQPPKILEPFGRQIRTTSRGWMLRACGQWVL
jgi:hypothetical protein